MPTRTESSTIGKHLNIQKEEYSEIFNARKVFGFKFQQGCYSGLFEY
jgi:hypothetical protein